ncbi:MAG TPA: uroporphyrinogen decarboxylase family protein [Phycisphaerae bacterium]|nr:uroporphyrinogen decarboxylase family protein [Phycisphaerae bacterium]
MRHVYLILACVPAALAGAPRAGDAMNVWIAPGRAGRGLRPAERQLRGLPAVVEVTGRPAPAAACISTAFGAGNMERLMIELTSRERIGRILRREPVDRIGLCESFWGDTKARWVADGHLAEEDSLEDHFGLDIRRSGGFTLAAWLDYKEEIVEETDETKLVRNPNGAVLRWWKGKSGTPEHVDFLVKDRAGWAEHIKPHLTDPAGYRKRMNLDAYRAARQDCAERGLFLAWAGLNVFECMHPVCGHENMLIGMIDDPAWVKDMCDTYAELLVNLMEIKFAEAGEPDGIWFYEDMGFKGKPFMSPAMYKELVWPAHKRTFEYAHSRNLPVIVHSCGYVEPLVPGLIEAGMDCLQAIEVKAGMDLLQLKRDYGEHIAFMGGVDVRPLVANDRDAIRAELETKLPAAMAGGGYCLHSDHSIPNQVDYETYRYFVDLGLEIGTY